MTAVFPDLRRIILVEKRATAARVQRFVRHRRMIGLMALVISKWFDVRFGNSFDS